MMSVTIILKSCANRNAYNGRFVSELNKSENFVSNPMLVNASTNHRVWILFTLSFILLIVEGLRKKEKSTEAIMNPIMNFGNRSQMTPSPGLFSFDLSPSFLVYVQ